MTPQRPALAALADRAGILPEYVDQTGHEHRVTSDETRVALLAAMGYDASDERGAQQALDELTRCERERLVAPTCVVQAPAGATTAALALPVALPAGWRDAAWQLVVTDEAGSEHRAEGRATASADGELAVGVPVPLGLGYHTVRLTLRSAQGERSATQRLIVTPPACPAPESVLGGRPAYGLIANLYAVRSARNWGAGDFTDLGTLVELAAGTGAAFVGVNPLHALRNTDGAISPYSPVSRLFRNVLYLDVDAVPELAAAPDARELARRPEFAAELARLRAAPRVDYAAVMRLKRPVLELLHRRFRAAASPHRREDFEEFVAEQGDALRDFATFVALEEHLARDAGAPASWRDWPNEYRDPRSEAVARFRAEHAEAVDFHRWLQFELDAQLAEVAQRGLELGLPIGLYQDLAIGTSGTSSDAWAFPGLFLDGVSVGAPPDALGPQGQNWGLPPVDPRRLAEQGYAYWITLVRGALRHAGALRIDHALGLFRQFWIPAGMTGDHGAYVRFPTRDLLGILALESTRAEALVVGEDLGTVPPEVAPTLAEWRVLSSKVFYFEREPNGDFKPAAAYPPTALATANTHDLPTLAGYWRGRDVELRRAVGLLDSADAEEEARAERARDREALLRLLKAEGLVRSANPDAIDDLTLRAAVHTFLRRSPSWLVGLSLDDLAGETEPVNLPGVAAEQFSSWTRRLTMPLEEMLKSRAVRRAMGKGRER